MRELLKNLRKKDNDSLIELLNYHQTKYNKFFDLEYNYGCKDNYTKYNLDLYLSNLNKIKKVLNERNVKIEFINCWEEVK